MLEQEQSKRWISPHKKQWENAFHVPVIFEKKLTVIAKVFIYYKVGIVSLAQKKELKRQEDEYLKRLKSCRVRGLKEAERA